MNSMESMSFLKSKFGKNPIFGQDKLEDRHRDRQDKKSTLSKNGQPITLRGCN